MLVEVQTLNGPRKVRVCDYCRTVCIPSGRFCSGHCARNHAERIRHDSQSQKTPRDNSTDQH